MPSDRLLMNCNKCGESKKGSSVSCVFERGAVRRHGGSSLPPTRRRRAGGLFGQLEPPFSAELEWSRSREREVQRAGFRASTAF